MNRCPYCGHRTADYRSATCFYCRDLRRLDRERESVLRFPAMVDDSAPPMRDELREAVQAARERQA